MTNKSNPYKAMDLATQKKAIASGRNRGQKLKLDMVELANGFLLHYVQHGDMSNAMVIADMLGDIYTKGVRKAFIDWCQEYTTTLRWNEKEKTLEHVKGRDRKVKADKNGSNHFEVPFFDFVVEVTRPVDFKASIIKAIKRGATALSEGNTKDYSDTDVQEAIKFALRMGWMQQEDAPELPAQTQGAKEKAA